MRSRREDDRTRRRDRLTRPAIDGAFQTSMWAMKVRWAIPLLLTVAAACAPLADVAPAGTGRAAIGACTRTVSRSAAFSGAAANDALGLIASGPDCASAVVTITIRPPDGAPHILFSAPLARLYHRIDPAQALAPLELAVFLQTYVDAVQFDAAASTLPKWKTDESTPGFDDGLELYSPIDRARYEALRTAKPNMLCMMDGPESSVCYVWDVKAARPVAILRNGG